jgi:dihydrolipoamide dehydrogenase
MVRVLSQSYGHGPIQGSGFNPTQKPATSTPGVWAIGDVTVGPWLDHKAEDEGVACVETLAGHGDYGVIPSVTYTSPEIAWDGLIEERVKASGRSYKLGRFPFSADNRPKLQHEGGGCVKAISCTERWETCP